MYNDETLFTMYSFFFTNRSISLDKYFTLCRLPNEHCIYELLQWVHV